MNNFDYKNLTPFKWFVLENFPFIENDFDAINNYHLFSKVVEYLNNTIDSMNLTGEQMENVTNAMTNLQNYVNNYFDNLDVQEEINNKLDEMAENGTLTQLIKQYIDPIYENYENEINTTLSNMQSQITNGLEEISSGTPLVASSMNDMIDTSRIYVLTTNGHWYWYNGTSWQDGGVYQTAENSNAVNELIDYIGKGSVNLYNKRDLSWTRANWDSVPFNLKEGRYIISFISTGSSGTFTVNFRNGTTNVANKVLNNVDFNIRNYFDIELSGDATNFRIWNDVACEIKDIMIIPYDFGNLEYIKSILSNEDIVNILNNNFDYINNTVINKMENDLSETVDITENFVSSGDYGYAYTKEYNTATLYTQGGTSNYHNIYNVSFNEHFKIKLYNPTSGAMSPILITDDDLQVIYFIKLTSEEEIGAEEEYDIKIPYGATKLLISYRVGSAYPISVKKYEFRDLDDVINEINSGIPSYYDNYLPQKINEIHSLEQSIGAYGDTVAFITDIHVPSNSMISPYLLRDIYNKTNLKMVIDGGDSAFGGSSVTNTKELAISELYQSVNTFNPVLNNRIIRCFGNHDDNGYGAYYQGQERLSKNEVFGILFKRQLDKVKIDSNNPYGYYCYYDNPEQKIRYVLLNTDETGDKKGFSVECTQWLVNEAFIFPSSGWSVAIFTHQPIKDNGNYYKHRELFGALNNGTTFNWEGTYGTAVYNIHADFTGNKQADVLFVACGHMHQDNIGIDNNVVYFQTTSDAHYNDDYSQLGYRRDVGTIYEQAFDVICINKQTQHVNLIRIGAGNNREFIYGATPSIS